MVRTVVRDVFFLAQKSEPATKDDLGTVQDIRTFIFVSTARSIPDGSRRSFSMSATI